MTQPVQLFTTTPDSLAFVVDTRTIAVSSLAICGQRVAVPRDRLSVVDIVGLSSDTPYRLELDGMTTQVCRTLPRPAGTLLSRVATMSDLHIGERAVGHVPRIASQPERGDVDPRDGHAYRALVAATTEIARWNPDLLVVKGDIAHTNRRWEYDLALPVIAGANLPTVLMRGNHDGGNHAHDNFAAEVQRHAMRWSAVQVVDLPGVRVIAADTVRIGTDRGFVDAISEAVIDAASDARDRACLVFLHQQFQHSRPHWYVPAGIERRSGYDFLRRLKTAHPAATVSTGHTHRNRRHVVEGVTVTEVGSIKDFPGVWAGYEVYEGGIVQWVRRVADADTLLWTERTARTALGLWRRWAPGTLESRCFTLMTPTTS